MTIRSWAGTEWEGVLLCRRGLEMRVAVAGWADAAVIRHRGGQWFAENGDPVEIEMHTNAPGPYREPATSGGCCDDLRQRGSSAPAWLN